MKNRFLNEKMREWHDEYLRDAIKADPDITAERLNELLEQWWNTRESWKIIPSCQATKGWQKQNEKLENDDKWYELIVKMEDKWYELVVVKMEDVVSIVNMVMNEWPEVGDCLILQRGSTAHR